MDILNFIYEHSGTLFIIAVILGLMFLAVLFMVAVGVGNQKHDMMMEQEMKKRKAQSNPHLESCVPLRYQKGNDEKQK